MGMVSRCATPIQTAAERLRDHRLSIAVLCSALHEMPNSHGCERLPMVNTVVVCELSQRVLWAEGGRRGRFDCHHRPVDVASGMPPSLTLFLQSLTGWAVGCCRAVPGAPL